MFVTLQTRFDQAMGQLTGPQPPQIIGVSVSGGGDSMALMHLAARWAKGAGVKLAVATIDHGLRPQSAGEAAMVARAAAALNLPHDTLKWTGWDGQGNLQDAARRARTRLLAHWRGPIRHILTGHTADDQAETFLMRLARGSGVEGLSAMRAHRHITDADIDTDTDTDTTTGATTDAGGFAILRPLLEMRRAELRDYLRAQAIPWVEDPSNDDPRFDRVKARRALTLLEPLGLTTQTLADTAGRMRRSQQALAARATQVATQLTQTTPSGDLLIQSAGLAKVETDTRLRILAAALRWVSSNPYRPRAQALCRALQEAEGGKTATLHGCLILPGRTHLRVTREFQAVKDQVSTATPATFWDHRWQVSLPDNKDLHIRALGPDGLEQLDQITPDAPPRAALLATPSLWDGARLVAAPFAGFGQSCEITLAPAAQDFVSCLLSH